MKYTAEHLRDRRPAELPAGRGPGRHRPLAHRPAEGVPRQDGLQQLRHLAGTAGPGGQAEPVPCRPRRRHDLRQRDVQLVRRHRGGRRLLLPGAPRDLLRVVLHEGHPGHGQRQLLHQHLAHRRQRRGVPGRADGIAAPARHRPGGSAAGGPAGDRQTSGAPSRPNCGGS